MSADLLPSVPQPVALRFRADRGAELRADLSALALEADGTLWLACDEGPTVERLRWDGTEFAAHESFALADWFDLPAGPKGEADLEGLAVADGFLWMVGSHGRRLRKHKKSLDDAENLARLEWRETRFEPNRYLLGRVPLVDGQPQPKGAAALKFSAAGNELLAALADDPHLGPYIAAGLPAKANGFDIEGLAVRGPRVLLGLRGPALLDWAVVLEIEPREKKPGTLSLKKLGPGDRPYRKHFVNLEGLGVRDLAFRGDDLLILAGPTLYMDGPSRVYRVPNFANDDEPDRLVRPEWLFDLACGRGKDHPEGIAVSESLGPAPALLVVHDAPLPARLLGPDRLLAEWHALPGR
jgi:hypothetical protein